MNYHASNSSGARSPNCHGLLATLFLKTCLGLALCFSLPSAFANNPGGFTNTVTTAVTTGTEAFGSRTDHFLDNGILHVLIADSGNVDSIKYLKPGSPGTPKANGIEMVSQSGTNFGNHTAIYYWFYPDTNGGAVYQKTNGGAVYQKTTGDANHMEVTCVPGRAPPRCLRCGHMGGSGRAGRGNRERSGQLAVPVGRPPVLGAGRRRRDFHHS